MKRRHPSRLALILGGLAMSPSIGHALVFWAADVEVGTGSPINPDFALGEPDGAVMNVTAGSSTTFSSFDDAVNDDLAALASLLGEPLSTVQNADVISFERNGTPNLCFEGSSWTFSSGGESETIVVPAGVLASGNVSIANMAAFFGFPPTGTGDFAFILLQLNTADPAASDFELVLEPAADCPGLPGSNTADPDAIGRIASDAVSVDESVRIETWGKIKAGFTGPRR